MKWNKFPYSNIGKVNTIRDILPSYPVEIRKFFINKKTKEKTSEKTDATRTVHNIKNAQLKKYFKNINKKISNAILEEKPHYLESGMMRHSSITNARKHWKSRDILVMDITSFFDNVTTNDVALFFQRKLNNSPQVSKILAEFFTHDGRLTQGFPTSANLAFLAKYDMFEKINRYCMYRKMKFSLYVDDITISGTINNKEELINDITSIVNSYNLEIKKEKTEFYSEKGIVTGIWVGKGTFAISNKQKNACIDEINKLRIITNKIATKSLYKDAIKSLAKISGYFSYFTAYGKFNNSFEIYKFLKIKKSCVENLERFIHSMQKYQISKNSKRNWIFIQRKFKELKGIMKSIDYQTK